MPRRFKAAVLREYGSPFSIEEMELEAPEGWVWVRVKAVGVCGRDKVVWRGGFRNLKPPLILGHEVFGLHEGEPVGVYPGLPGDPPGVIGENTPGGYAEYLAAPPGNLVRLPDERYSEYAAAVCGVATFIHASKVAGVGSGDRVLVTGAAGGVGIHGVQWLVKTLKAEVYGYTRRPQARKVLEELGVHPVDSLDFYRREGKVDYVFELVGAATINESLRALKPQGTLVLIGNVHGKPVTIERPAMLVMRELKITGSAAFTIDEYQEAIQAVHRGDVKAFYKEYPLEEVNKAYQDLEEGKILGRAVLLA